MVDGFVVVPNTEINIEKKIKIVLLGDQGVGKTCLLLQLCYKSNTISRKHLESFSNTYKANIIVDGKVYQLELWDSDCVDSNDNTTCPTAYQETDVFCVCFSVGDLESLRHVENKCYQDIKKHSPKTPIILVGTKADLREAQEKRREKHDEGSTLVSHKMGKKAKKKLGAVKYLECSALTQRGYVEVFTEAVKACLAHSKKGNKCSIL